MLVKAMCSKLKKYDKERAADLAEVERMRNGLKARRGTI
jgi:hypothetical protein